MILGVRLVFSRFEVGIYECFLDPGFVTISSLVIRPVLGFRWPILNLEKERTYLDLATCLLLKLVLSGYKLKVQNQVKVQAHFSKEKFIMYQIQEIQLTKNWTKYSKIPKHFKSFCLLDHTPMCKACCMPFI